MSYKRRKPVRRPRRPASRKRRCGIPFLFFAGILICLLAPLALLILFSDQNDLRPHQIGTGSLDHATIQVFRQEQGRVEEVLMEDYVKGVLAGEMPSSFPMEALKAQAVAARTYGLARQQKLTREKGIGHAGAPVCDTTHCQVYRTPEELLALKGKDWMNTGWLRIEEAVELTRGQVLTYQGSLAEQPLFHSASGGRTENSEDVFVAMVPYLRSVDSPYEEEAPHQNETLTLTLKEFAKKVNAAYPKLKTSSVNRDTVVIQSRSQGEGVEKIKVGNLTLTGSQVRSILGLRSSQFTIGIDGSKILFTTDGYGHGVGMSQWGASGMAKAGYSYQEILTHYYQGVEIQQATVPSQ